MCGIFSVISKNSNAPTLVLEGLKKLEYRGYDSFGVCQISNKGVENLKFVGEIPDDQSSVKINRESHIAIGHTRWATHGGVTTQNAHPHLSQNKKFAIVHNGIVENFKELKIELLKKYDYKFLSETDTEVIIALFQFYMQNHNALETLQILHKKLRGRYSFVILNVEENKLYALRNGAPLIIGHCEDKEKIFIASDVPAFVKYTQNVIYLDDNQTAEFSISNDGILSSYKNINTLEKIEKRIIKVEINVEDTELGEHSHFMIKEIWEQKDSIKKALNQVDSTIKTFVDQYHKAEKLIFIGCGTAHKVAICTRYFFNQLTNKLALSEISSELKHFKNIIDEKTIVVAISQSGETAETIEAIEIAKNKKAFTACITNVRESSLDRICDLSLFINAGTEKAVASTKATTGQMAIGSLLAHACAGKLNEGRLLLSNTGALINDMLNPRYESLIENLAKELRYANDIYIIGKGSNYPIALESAIKLQEVSYIHAEGFAGGELKHGPLALITKQTPVIVIAANDNCYQEIISNAIEIKSRGGYIIGISPIFNEVFDVWLKVPEAAIDNPIVNLIPIQILSYHLAVLKDNNPDKPRNLAKSVTVK